MLLDQLAALPTLGMPVDSFLASASTLKVAPHTCPELSTLGTGFNSLSGCSKLLKPPDVVKKHPEMKRDKNRYLLHETIVMYLMEGERYAMDIQIAGYEELEMKFKFQSRQ
jgi:hypothetical protein